MSYFPSSQRNVSLSLLLLFKKGQEIGLTSEEVFHIKNYFYLATLCSGSQGKRWFYSKGQQILSDELKRSKGNLCKIPEGKFQYLGEIFDSAVDTLMKTSTNRFNRAVNLAETRANL